MSDALKALNQKNLGVDSLNRGTTPLPLYEEGESLTALKVVPSAGIDPATGKDTGRMYPLNRKLTLGLNLKF